MIFGIPAKFKKYVAGRYVSPNIPDDLLKELKEFEKELTKVSGRTHFDFPR